MLQEISKNINLLLAEKNSEVRIGLCAALRQHGYKNVNETSEYSQVVATIEQGDIDLLIVDANLGGYNFPKLLNQVRHHEIGKNPFFATILLTTDHSTENIHKLIDCGSDDVLIKPVSPGALIDRIDALTWRRKGFVVTTDYIGPDRRETLRPGSQQIPVVEVPNALRYKAERMGSTSDFQREVAASIKTINGQKMERHAFQIEYLANEIIPQYENGTVDNSIIASIDRLQFVTHDLCQRLVDTDKEYISELGETFSQVIQSIQDQPLSPKNKDIQLLAELSHAIKQAFVADEDDIQAAADISASIAQISH